MDSSSAFVSRRLPFARKLMYFAPLLFAGQQAMALELDNRTFNSIDRDIAEPINMKNQAVLNMTRGSGQDITARNGSSVNLNGTTIKAGTGQDGVWLSNSHATIIGGSITADATGLLLARVNGSGTGSTASVTGTVITGATGASVSMDSVLQLSNAQVTGTTQDGLRMFTGTVMASNGTIIRGAENGVQIFGESTGTGLGNLTLDNSTVIGESGAAILVNGIAGDPQATINVNNGSQLQGADGVLLQVAGNGSATFNVSSSVLTGDVVVEEGSTGAVNLLNGSVLTGRLENVEALSVNSAAQWVMVEDSTVQNLEMGSGGSIKFGNPGDFYTLSVENLSGNGIFEMEADFSQGLSDKLEVTGVADGNHEILVHSSGADPLSDARLLLVEIAGGNAQFALLGGEVDLGTWSYGLAQDGNKWYLDASTRKISPGARTALAIFEAGPTVLYGELSTLRSRMGEIRMNDSKAGGWMRTYGNKFNVSAQGSSYSQVQQGLAFGVDAPLPYGDGQWLIGLLGGYSTSDLDMSRGTSGKIDSYYAGVYSTWLQPESGYYVDGVLKFNRFQNQADVHLSDGATAKGDFDNGAVTASVEAGRHIKLNDDWFVEPYGQLVGALIQGQSYDLDNGMQVDGDRSRSLLGKVGVTAGRDILMSNQMRVQPYVRAALAHEFVNGNEVEVNDNRFDNDLSGSRGELGAGIALSLTNRIAVHADFDYSNGETIEQPWGANFGVRYNW
ncbi:autotransporter outer membrane beta-barrel domain-containing protein [Pseudomonas sp. Marseille-P9899]|uniref:autotransporter outer membrane beta-barrel domain-containing protein n=1 Tax=Pseudomonas sp. Marseille-P9899 TaxID=2730401 RepID=UPI002113C2C1|nr:autotransporter outer membrane beta-barrel domain-containing protein [Pseudomonas sp. Marseille-P9899]